MQGAVRSILFFLFVSLVTGITGCAKPAVTKGQRLFWPIGNPEPRIEYLRFYATDKDVRQGRQLLAERVLLGETAPVQVFRSPYDVAWNGGRLFVSDPGLRQVLVVDFAAMKYASLMDAKGNPQFFRQPLGVAPYGDGLLVADPEVREISLFDAEGKHLRSFGKGDLVSPVAACYDSSSGRFYVVDTRANRVVVFDREGFPEFAFGSFGGNGGEFRYPVDIEQGPDGNLYVLDSLNARVAVHDLSGNFIRSIGTRGTTEGSLQIPKGLAVDRWGHVYVTESQSHKIVMYGLHGEFLMSIGAYGTTGSVVTPGAFNLPKGIAVDPSGRIAVVDTYNRIIHEYQYLDEEYLRRFPYGPEDIFNPFEEYLKD